VDMCLLVFVYVGICVDAKETLCTHFLPGGTVADSVEELTLPIDNVLQQLGLLISPGLFRRLIIRRLIIFLASETGDTFARCETIADFEAVAKCETLVKCESWR
jgi:hypothetical protein